MTIAALFVWRATAKTQSVLVIPDSTSALSTATSPIPTRPPTQPIATAEEHVQELALSTLESTATG